MSKEFLDISTGYRFSKLQFGSVPSIPVAVLALPTLLCKYVATYNIKKIDLRFNQHIYRTVVVNTTVIKSTHMLY